MQHHGKRPAADARCGTVACVIRPSSDSTFPSAPRSTAGATSLIDHACARFEAEQLAEAFSPLFPDNLPWQRVADAKGKLKPRIQARLTDITAAVATYKEALTVTAGALTTWLDASEEDIRALALSFAKLEIPKEPEEIDDDGEDDLPVPYTSNCLADFPGMAELRQHPDLPACPLTKKMLWARIILKSEVPGRTVAAQLSRLSDARFWRRAIRVLLMREREHFFMRLRLVGKSAEAYPMPSCPPALPS